MHTIVTLLPPGSTVRFPDLPPERRRDPFALIDPVRLIERRALALAFDRNADWIVLDDQGENHYVGLETSLHVPDERPPSELAATLARVETTLARIAEQASEPEDELIL